MGIRLCELEFTNFANFYTGLGVRHLQFDFTKMTNLLCVIVGKNGRGKTSLLSYMTPFAGIGNIEARDNNRLILEKEKGYKRVVLEDDDLNIYEIRHFYTPEKDSHTIKSYITFNGNELNENGNVMSFKAIVNEHLGIEPEYLKLIRIGDNVQNLIKSKDTDRKVFMGKILDEVDAYLKQYKKMAKISTEVKAVIGHLSDSIAKTGILDVDAHKRFIKELKFELEDAQNKLSEANEARNRIQYELDMISYPADGNFTIRDLEKKVTKYEKVREEKPNQTSANVVADINKKNVELAEKRATLHGMYDKLKLILDEIDSSNNKKLDIQIEIRKEEEKLNLTTMRDHVRKLQIQANETYESRFDELRPDVTKEEYDKFVTLIRGVQVQLDRIYEFGRDVVGDVVDTMVSQQDVSSLITSSLIQLEAENRADKLAILDRLIDKYVGRAYNCEDGKCPYRMLYNELLEIKDAVPVMKVKRDESYYYAMKNVNDSLSDVMGVIRDSANLLKKMPQEITDIFLMDKLLAHIKKCEKIYSDETVDKWSTFITDIHNYDMLIEDLNEQKARLKILEDASHEVYLNKQLEEVENALKSLLEQKEDLSEKISSLEDFIIEDENTLIGLQTTKDALELYEGTKSELDRLTDMREKDIDARERLRVKTVAAGEILTKVQKLEAQERAATNALDQHTKLNRELREYLRVQDRLDHLKYATSNKTGIPLLNIELYLRDTVRIANDLLDIVYDGTTYLDVFDITDNIFRMPFVKNGIEIPDVINASQGEQSFFNMAISSALRAQSMERYNIMLLDEPDGVFDDDNRQKVIPVLEKMLDLTKSSQAFLITHNQMFRQYPTDIINFDNLADSTIPVNWN